MSKFKNTSECFNVSVMIGMRLLIFGTCSLWPVLASLISSIRALFTSSEPLSFEGADNTAVIWFIKSMFAGDGAKMKIYRVKVKCERNKVWKQMGHYQNRNTANQPSSYYLRKSFKSYIGLQSGYIGYPKMVLQLEKSSKLNYHTYHKVFVLIWSKYIQRW